MVDLLVVYILLYCVLNVSLDSRKDNTFEYLFLNAGDIHKDTTKIDVFFFYVAT